MDKHTANLHSSREEKLFPVWFCAWGHTVLLKFGQKFCEVTRTAKWNYLERLRVNGSNLNCTNHSRIRALRGKRKTRRDLPFFAFVSATRALIVTPFLTPVSLR